MYMWAGLNRFEASIDFELYNVRISMGCMNLSYCYRMTYTGTRTLKSTNIVLLNLS